MVCMSSIEDKTVLTIDIETESTTTEKEDALNPRKNRITVIGVQNIGYGGGVQVYRNLETFKKEVWEDPDFVFCGHNFKWDFKVLAHHLGELPANGFEAYAADTRLMAFILTQKIPETWLMKYEEQRKILNKELPAGINHREAGKHSLKTLAPYFLDVEPFWEDPTNHDSDEYVMKDVKYTTELYWELADRLQSNNQWDFYRKAMTWARTLLRAKVTGFSIDMNELDQMEKMLLKREQILKMEITHQWKEAFAAYKTKGIEELQEKYQTMFEVAYKKPAKKPKDVQALSNKYQGLYEKAAAQASFELNLDSPTQMKWLLKDYLGHDIRNFDGEESTGVEVLEKLSKADSNVQTLLDYRATSKILTAFLPTYRSEEYNGKIYSTFNFDGTRTGRLSSSKPNLQQVPSDLKKLFKAKPGTYFATYDLGAIEPVILAYFSQDKELCDIILEGRSFHSANALEMFSDLMEPGTTEKDVKKYYNNLRDVAKTLGLSILYGSGYNRVKIAAMKAGISLTDKACKNIVYGLRDKYSGVWEFKQELDQELESGQVLFNLFGRPFKIENPDEVYMKGLNTLIQGSGSDLTMQAATDIGMIPGCTPIAFIHDSVVTEIQEEYESSAICEKIVHEFTKFELKLSDGRLLPLTVEGGVSNVWE